MFHPFYLIVDSPDWLQRLCPVGLRLAQLRIKGKQPGATTALIQDGLRIAAHHDCTLVINDHWREAIDAKAEWVHLGQEDLDIADITALKQAGIKIGLSTHTPEELDRALEINPDYIALGPIFEPRGKSVDHAPRGLRWITNWKARIKCPLIAIGGIRLEQAREVFSAGADTVCVITDVLEDSAPEARCRAWLDAAKHKN